MPTPTFQPPQGQQDTAQLQDWIIKLVRDLNYLLSCLDTVNINRLDANVIIANTITANKMNVSQLSAIAADLGTITAGIIYGAYIATANGTYPRIELSSAAKLLTAYLDAVNHLDIVTNYLGSPGIKSTSAAGLGYIVNGSAFGLYASGLPAELGSTSNVNISASGNLFVSSVNGSFADLISTINSKANSFSGYTGSFVSGTKTVTVNNGIITSVV